MTTWHSHHSTAQWVTLEPATSHIRLWSSAKAKDGCQSGILPVANYNKDITTKIVEKHYANG